MLFLLNFEPLETGFPEKRTDLRSARRAYGVAVNRLLPPGARQYLLDPCTAIPSRYHGAEGDQTTQVRITIRKRAALH